ncbi:rhomboid family intramembrane serine protease, partial [Streptomyces sp. SID7803]|nr:rhomboid family intramembrane serine protease [Streptomyces sp. SID7803]
PSELWDGSAHALLTPLTALFVHGSWLHLLGNILFLYVFGAMAEERMGGHTEFALFYLGCGYLALLGYAAAHASSDQTLVGASGGRSRECWERSSTSSPRARSPASSRSCCSCRCASPAWVVLIFWFVLQWLAARGRGSGPGVAYLAHVVGFATGFLYAWGPLQA